MDAQITRRRFLTDHRITQSQVWQEDTRQIGRQRFRGYLGSIIHAVRVALTWRAADVLISANVRNAVLYCLMKRILPFRAPSIMVLELRLDDPRPSWVWQAKRAFQRFAMRSVSMICVSSKREVETYAERWMLDVGRFRFVPWHTNILSPRVVETRKGYVFSAGRTGRDWTTFFKAVNGLPCKIVVVCAREDLPRGEIPENLEVHTDVSYDEYRKLLEAARVVVVPLQEHVYSSGQVAFLEAMALGKPVVATDCIGTEDYMEHGRNGLLVPPRSPKAMRDEIVRLLTDSVLEERLRRAAVRTVLENHTLDVYVSTVLTLARGLAQKGAEMGAETEEH